MKGTWEERLGREAYDTYRREVDGMGVLADWEYLPEPVRRAWGRVAKAVVHKASLEGSPKHDRMK